jgi:hypothetical protein
MEMVAELERGDQIVAAALETRHDVADLPLASEWSTRI